MALHVNYEVRWKNFKGFKDTKWIKIKPITIFLGSNNAGKTSFLAPFLLMNQTVTSRDSSSPLIIRGRIYDGGNIKELLNDYDLSKELFFGFKYHTHEVPKRLKKVGNYPPGVVEVTFKVNNNIDRDLFVKSEAVYDIYSRPLLKLIRNKEGQYDLSGIKLTGMSVEEQNSIKKSSPLNFLFSPNALLSSMRREVEEQDENAATKRLSKSFSELLQAISFNFSLASEILGDISYLGPIRENPKRYYELRNENYNTVGPRGENLPDLLKKNFSKIEIELNEWVQKFGFGDKLELKKLSNTIYSILFRNNGDDNYTNIANAGFGASQILPLIVQALVSPAETLTIAEQPEIHLNPRLQCVLADLFAYMSKKDQRVIVETHSEHLLLRLRLLVANKTISADDIAIYFVDKVNNESKVREIEIEADGHVNPSEWPSGFFEESLRDSLALATEQLKNAN